MTMRFLATSETQRDVAFNFLVGRSTVSSIVSEVSEALWLVLQPLYLQHPSTTDEWMKISQEFHERWNILHCLGAIVGKRVTIECPANSGSINFNYKGSFSKSLLAVCDAQYSSPGATDSEDWEGHLSPGSWRDEEEAGGALIPSRPTGCNAARYAKEV
ncbi:hypothetical protein MRX96_020789 [Rhipicephalus microplus]